MLYGCNFPSLLLNQMYLMSDVVSAVKKIISLQGGTDIDNTKLQEQITFRKCMLLFSPDIFVLCLLSDNAHKNI